MVSKTQFGHIRPHGLEEEMRSSYLTYAMTVIVGRALPDVRDGLKPVQRRILYAAHEMGMRPNSSYRKSARLVGDVLGKYHPHGEGAVYDAMVRLAQEFSLRVPLIDGQGNFGSVDNDPPAAMRYTEGRLSSAAEEMLANLDQETVDFVDNFDGSLQEPVVLPARLPNLLVNGAAGIAVGMATNIPPHNPAEVCDGIIHLIDRPTATDEDLMQFVPGPDFPTAATIMGREGIKNAYTTGRGQIIMRAVAEIEPMKRSNRMQIVVTELPYQVNKAGLIEKIAAHVKNKRLDGITEIRDESDRRGMRIVMELRNGAQGMVILNNLYKLTEMQKSFSANMMALVNGKPELLTLRSALQNYVDFRREVVRRRTEFELRKAKARAHILEGLRIALENLDAVIELIRNAADVEAARTGLMNRFALDEKQAQAILDMQLRRLAALEREKIENEYREIQETISRLEELLGDPRKVDLEIKKETRALKKKIDGERLTQISDASIDINRDDIEPHEQVVITFSKGGYIKRIPAATFRNQHRGGKGVSGMNTRDNDPVRHILVVDTHDMLLFFTSRGRVLPLKTYEIRPDTSRNTRGVPVVNVIPLSDEEQVEAIIGVKSLDQPDLYLVMATEQGSVKRTALNAIANIRRAGLIIFNLREKDMLVTARLAHETDDVMMVTEQGMSIRFPVQDVKPRLRAAGGVRGMLLAKRDKIVSMDMVIPDSKLLVISKNGYGKLTYLKSYRQQGRGGSGIKTMSVTRRTGKVAAAEVIADSDEVYVVSEQAQVIRTNLSEIRSTGRATQGVRIFNPNKGDKVASISCVGEFEV
ncbi:MAG: DNA gyrase subunit A, partial [Chloroflexota bacterium]|nr:DNA gyrase subunit A [Chloroflexota bacterium]